MVKSQLQFKAGDWVKCTRPGNSGALKENALYQIKKSRISVHTGWEFVSLADGDFSDDYSADRFVKATKKEVDAYIKANTLKCPCCGERTNLYNAKGGYWSCSYCPVVIFEYHTAMDIDQLKQELEAH